MLPAAVGILPTALTASNWIAISSSVLSGNMPDRAGNMPRAPQARETHALPFPEKFYRTIDFRRQAFVHRTIERGLLEHFALRMIFWQWNMDFGRQSNDPTRRVLRHFLLH
jgi:hypothetical protein